MLFLYPLTAYKIVGTDMSTPRCCSGSPGMAYLIHGDVNTHAMAWLLVGSIPGVLIGSQIGVKVPGARRCASLRLRADPVRDQGLRRPQLDLRDRGRCSLRRARADGLGHPAAAHPPVAARTRRRRIARRLARVLAIVFVVALLAATAAAFALTEWRKLETSPIY